MVGLDLRVPWGGDAGAGLEGEISGAATRTEGKRNLGADELVDCRQPAIAAQRPEFRASISPRATSQLHPDSIRPAWQANAPSPIPPLPGPDPAKPSRRMPFPATGKPFVT